MGQQPLTLGAGLGGQAAAYGANAGRSLLAGGLSAAELNNVVLATVH
jgi:hypothetical protein